MSRLRQIVPGLLLAASLGGAAVYAAADPAAYPDGPPAGGWHRHGHGGALGPMGMVLHQLNLTTEQKSEIKALMAAQKSQFSALRASMKANHEALATTPPTDSSYAALIQTEEQNATQRIVLVSGLWTQIYSTVLTPAQQSQIPSLVAAAQASRQARMEAWKAQRAESTPPATE